MSATSTFTAATLAAHTPLGKPELCTALLRQALLPVLPVNMPAQCGEENNGILTGVSLPRLVGHPLSPGENLADWIESTCKRHERMALGDESDV